MNTCKTCKWWVGEEFRGSRRCTNVLLSPDAEYVENVARATGFDWEPIEKPNFVRTGPDFGCVHHEPQ